MTKNDILVGTIFKLNGHQYVLGPYEGAIYSFIDYFTDNIVAYVSQATMEAFLPDLELIKLGTGSYHKHDWKHYIGFTDVFDYCNDCQEKRV